MHLDIIALVFGVIFIAELPDKSLFASLILGSRYPALFVWAGAATAFLIHVVIAVTAGHFLTLLPHRVLEVVIGTLFLGGATLLFFGKHGLEEEPPHVKQPSPQQEHSFWRVFGMAFSVVFLGEWGDITQITTANYAAHYHDTLNVAVGAVLGLWAVTAAAIIAGSRILNLVPQKTLLRFTGLILLLFGLASYVSAIK